MKGRREKQVFSRCKYQWEGSGYKGRVSEVNMVDAFYILL
jgi:hypothetical protein